MQTGETMESTSGAWARRNRLTIVDVTRVVLGSAAPRSSALAIDGSNVARAGASVTE